MYSDIVHLQRIRTLGLAFQLHPVPGILGRQLRRHEDHHNLLYAGWASTYGLGTIAEAIV